VLAAAVMCLAVPGVAEAAGGPAQPASYASYTWHCPTGLVHNVYPDTFILDAPAVTGTVLETIPVLGVRACVQGSYVVGDQLSVCGGSNLSWWIQVWTSDGRLGYSPMRCWVDS
jgi:hypothetical protein